MTREVVDNTKETAFRHKKAGARRNSLRLRQRKTRVQYHSIDKENWAHISTPKQEALFELYF